MDIIRGIVSFSYGKESRELVIKSVGSVHFANDLHLLAPLSENAKVLGCIIENKYNICYEVELKNKEKFIGYITSKNGSELKFQTIKKFDKYLYNPFKPEYELGNKIEIGENEIVDIHFL